MMLIHFILLVLTVLECIKQPWELEFFFVFSCI